MDWSQRSEGTFLTTGTLVLRGLAEILSEKDLYYGLLAYFARAPKQLLKDPFLRPNPVTGRVAQVYAMKRGGREI
jgi:hypothetical protein